MPAFTKKSYTAVAGALFALLTPGLARGQVLTSPNTVGEPATTSPTSSGHTKIRALAVRVRAGEMITLLCSSQCTREDRCHRSLLKGLIERG